MDDCARDPLVSVVIPIHGHLNYAREAVASVLGQSMNDLEVILVDDGSPEDPAPLIDLDLRVRLVRQDTRERGAARNHGLREARGEFVAFLDADDLWLPGKLAADIPVLSSNPAAALVHSPVYLGDIDGLPYSRPMPRRRPPVGDVLEALAIRNFVAICTVLARRGLVAAVGGFAEDPDPGAEDWELWARLAHDHEIVFHARPTAIYRQGVGGTLANAGRMRIAYLRSVDRVFSLPRLRDREDLRCRAEARAHLTVAMSHYGAGEKRQGRGELANAVRRHPASLSDVRVVLTAMRLIVPSRVSARLRSYKRAILKRRRNRTPPESG